MTRNNIKLLTDSQYNQLNDKYIFELTEDSILVRLTTHGRVTEHALDKPFHINAKGIRKVCFSMDAIEIWKKMYNNGFPTLLAVQQAVNKLTITFQKVNEENVCKILSGQDIKIKRI